VLVDLKDNNTSPEYFIIPTKELDNALRALHEHWLNSPAKRGKPHSPDNRMFRFGGTKFQDEWLSKWKGAWPLILNEFDPSK